MRELRAVKTAGKPHGVKVRVKNSRYNRVYWLFNTQPKPTQTRMTSLEK